MDKDAVRAAVGPRADYYLRQFEKIEAGGRRWAPTWNWSAFFWSCAWFRYRGLSSYSSLNFVLVVAGVVLLYATSYPTPSALFQPFAIAFLAVEFGLIPAFANQLYFRHLARRPAARAPTTMSGLSAFLAGAFVLGVACVLFIGPLAYSDYVPRARVSEGVSLAQAMQREISDFHAGHKRLPNPEEARKFRASGAMRYTESVRYDPTRSMVVVTMQSGSAYGERRTFAVLASVRNGALTWQCRPLDLDPRYLPSRCR